MLDISVKKDILGCVSVTVQFETTKEVWHELNESGTFSQFEKRLIEFENKKGKDGLIRISEERTGTLEEKVADLVREVQRQQREIEALREAMVTGKKNDFASFFSKMR